MDSRVVLQRRVAKIPVPPSEPRIAKVQVLSKDHKRLVCVKLIEKETLNEVMRIMTQFLYATWCTNPCDFEKIRNKLLIQPMTDLIVKLLPGDIQNRLKEAKKFVLQDDFIWNICRPFFNQKENAVLCEKLFSIWWKANPSKWSTHLLIFKEMATQIKRGLLARNNIGIPPQNNKQINLELEKQYREQFACIKKITNNLDEPNPFVMDRYEKAYSMVNETAAAGSLSLAFYINLFLVFSFIAVLLGKLASIFIPELNPLTSWFAISLLATLSTGVAVYNYQRYGSPIVEQRLRLRCDDGFTDYPIAAALLDSIYKFAESLENSNNANVKKKNSHPSNSDQKKKQTEKSNVYKEASNDNFTNVMESEKSEFETNQIIREKIKTTKEKLEREFNAVCDKNKPLDKSKNQTTQPKTSTSQIKYRMEDGRIVIYDPDSTTSDLGMLRVKGSGIFTNQFVLRDPDRVKKLCPDPVLANKLNSNAEMSMFVSPKDNRGFVTVDDKTIKSKLIGKGNSHFRLFYVNQPVINISTNEKFDCFVPYKLTNRNKN